MDATLEQGSPLTGWMQREGPRARIRLRTLLLIRWGMVLGQLAAVLIVHLGLGYRLALEPVVATIAALALLNLGLWLALPRATRVGDLGGAALLSFDIFQLATLLGLTGGLQNPFSLLMLVPVTISATVLSLHSTAVLCLLAIAFASAITQVHLPLPWETRWVELPDLYVLGLWSALVLGILVIAGYAWRIAEESRRMGDALSATQLALAQEQRISALGALAAAAAHELGTPLATISVIVKEMTRELPAGSTLAGDVRQLQSEVARCRELLAQLPRKGASLEVAPVEALRVGALVRAVGETRQREGIALAVDARPEDTAPGSLEPLVPHRPEIIHGLGNLVDNAMRFAKARVELRLRWSDDQVGLTIMDDGPGFAPGILSLLGEPYLRRERDEGGMGLGVFIAKNLLQRTGAVLSFANRRTGGAQVSVLWRRKNVEARAALPRDPVPGA